MKTGWKRLGAVLCLGVALGTFSQGADQPKTDKAKNTEAAGKTVEMIEMAAQLREHGWGKDLRKGVIEDGSVEQLLTAARLLRTMPKPSAIDGDFESGYEKDAVADKSFKIESKAVTGDDFDKECKEILNRAQTLLDGMGEGKLKTAYLTILDDLKKQSGTKAVRGGPKAVSKTIAPHQWHTYHWDWDEHVAGSVAFKASTPIRVSVVRRDNDNAYATGINTHGIAHFLPGGHGVPTGRAVKLTVRVQNIGNVAANYQLFAN